MHADLQKHLDRATRPRSLNGLMNLYESNFRRLQALIPDTDFPFDEAVSLGRDGLELHLRVIERCKYTTTLHLTYFFDEDGQQVADPDLRIRVYADAHQAEALRADLSRHCPVLSGMDPSRGNFIRRRWSRNLMLNKWLAYCLETGHGFALSDRPREGRQRAAR